MPPPRLTESDRLELITLLGDCSHLIELLLEPGPMRNVQLAALDCDERTTRRLAKMIGQLHRWVGRLDLRE